MEGRFYPLAEGAEMQRMFLRVCREGGGFLSTAEGAESAENVCYMVRGAESAEALESAEMLSAAFSEVRSWKLEVGVASLLVF
jgi:hypothetical protein